MNPCGVEAVERRGAGRRTEGSGRTLGSKPPGRPLLPARSLTRAPPSLPTGPAPRGRGRGRVRSLVVVDPLLHPDEVGLATGATRLRRFEAVFGRGLVNRRPGVDDLTLFTDVQGHSLRSVCHGVTVGEAGNKPVARPQRVRNAAVERRGGHARRRVPATRHLVVHPSRGGARASGRHPSARVTDPENRRYSPPPERSCTPPAEAGAMRATRERAGAHPDDGGRRAAE